MVGREATMVTKRYKSVKAERRSHMVAGNENIGYFNSLNVLRHSNGKNCAHDLTHSQTTQKKSFKTGLHRNELDTLKSSCSIFTSLSFSTFIVFSSLDW